MDKYSFHICRFQNGLVKHLQVFAEVFQKSTHYSHLIIHEMQEAADTQYFLLH